MLPSSLTVGPECHFDLKCGSIRCISSLLPITSLLMLHASSPIFQQVHSSLSDILFIDEETWILEDTGVYEMEEETLYTFVCPSPKLWMAPWPRTEINLVLPPVSAFSKQGMSILSVNVDVLICSSRCTTDTLATDFWPEVHTMASSVHPWAVVGDFQRL